VSKYIIDRITDTESPAYCKVKRDGILLEWGGNFNAYGVSTLETGKDIGEQIIYLDGLSPDNKKSLFLPCVKTNSELFADIHVVPGGDEFWIILLDATTRAMQQQLLQQKGNTLSLLKEKLSKLWQHNYVDEFIDTLPGDDFIASNLLDVLGVVMLEAAPGDVFKLAGKPPEWFQKFYPSAVMGDQIPELADNFSFVENFLIDADLFWQQNSEGRFKSGTFIEIDLDGKEYAVEASAVFLSNKKILLFELLGASHEERKALLQRARENTLVCDYLEEEVRKQTEDIRRREEEIAIRLVWAVESRDKDTGDHIRRIGLYSATLAKAIGWSQSQVDDIYVASTMHDIGKIGIPDNILQKSGKLSDSEYEIMKTHTEIGASILENSDVPLLKMAREIALHHHERWDGSGYPFGLIGDAIPQSARIVIIADIFDALVSQRVYKSAGTEDNAVTSMTSEMKSYFDPDILNSFLDLLPVFHRIHQQF